MILRRTYQLYILAIGLLLNTALAEIHVVDPVKDTFVLNPGSGSSYSNAANHNYGGAGSRSVASASARAVDEEDGIDHEPKGEFRSLLQFDLSQIAHKTVGTIGLNLYISNGNESAFGVFNYRGHSGVFRVDWISNEWEQGYDTPHDDSNSSVGITYNSLEALLADSNQTWIADCEYDGENDYDNPQWYRFELPLEDENLRKAMKNGETISLMLSPVDANVAFNFTAYTQLNVKPSKTVYRDTGPYLDIETVNYCMVDDFESYDPNSQNIMSHWILNSESGLLSNLLAPLAYDGNQCMQFEFDNDGEILLDNTAYSVENYSEATYTLSPTMDWCAHGGASFCMVWAGDMSNTSLTSTDRLYIVLEDRSTAISNPVFCDGSLSDSAWHMWKLPLNEFSGVNIKQIKRITIGIGNPIEPQSGGCGYVWIDALRIYDCEASSIPNVE